MIKLKDLLSCCRSNVYIMTGPVPALIVSPSLNANGIIDIHIVFEALSEQLTIPYKYNRRTHTIEIREKVSHPIIIRGMYGSLRQTQGLYPDFYNCSSQEAETYLSERSTAVDGVGLKHVTDVVKIIDILKIVESNDDESDTAVDVNLGGYCE